MPKRTAKPVGHRKRRPRRPVENEPRAKLIVRIGDGEIQLEAGLAVVEARYDQAIERLLEVARPAAATRGKPATATPRLVAMRSVAPEHAEPARAPASAPSGNYPRFSLDPIEVAQHYAVNAAGVLSLRTLPRGLKPRERNADVLLLLLYGKLMLQEQSPCTAPALLSSARHSGLRLDRASRLLARHRPYVETTGRRRGVRYSLTPAGVEYCERLLSSLDVGYIVLLSVSPLQRNSRGMVPKF